MPHTPATRLELFETIAAAIGWGTTADDVAGFAVKLEALGVRFIPAALIPADVKNPYAPTEGSSYE